MFDLSIVIPTYNRAELLRRCLESIRGAANCHYEIIVVDGASSDHTGQILNDARHWLGNRLNVIHEEQREGFVRATNKGFRAATGRNMIWINDDVRPLPGVFDMAVQQMDQAPSDIALLAIFHRWHSMRNIAYQINHNGGWFCLLHVRGTLYANFGIGRRETFAQLGYFDEQFYADAADRDLSLKAWHAGMRIAPAYCVMVDHDEIRDKKRVEDTPRAKEDLEILLAKWNLPANNPLRNGFDPANPCTMKGLLQATAA